MSTEEFFNLTHLFIQFRIYLHISKQWFSTGGHCASRGRLAMPENVSGCHNWRGEKAVARKVCYRHLVSRGQGCG